MLDPTVADTHCSFQMNFLQHAIRYFENALFLHEALCSLSGCFMFGFYPHKWCLYSVLFNGQSLYFGKEIALTSFMLFLLLLLVFFLLKDSSGHFTGSSFVCLSLVGIFKAWFWVLFTLSPCDLFHFYKLNSHFIRGRFWNPISSPKGATVCVYLEVLQVVLTLNLPLPACSATCVLTVSPAPIVHSHLSSSPGLCLCLPLHILCHCLSSGPCLEYTVSYWGRLPHPVTLCLSSTVSTVLPKLTDHNA